MLWNDVKSAPQAAALVAEFGGAAEWAARTGSVPTMSFTVTKLRWLAENEPANAARVHRVLLPHDWLTWRLAGGGAGARRVPRADDRPGGRVGHRVLLPRRGHVAAGVRAAGARPAGRAAAGRRDRPRSSGGPSGARRCRPGPATTWARRSDSACVEGDVAVSIGTSGTAYAATAKPSADPTGLVCGFADATGRFLPLACTINAARVLDVTARMLGVDAGRAGRAGAAARPGPAA